MSRYFDSGPEYQQSVKDRTRQRRLDDPQKYLWVKARRRALVMGIDFDIEPSDLRIPSHCPALGIPIDILSIDRDHSATVDRIINERGYVKGNVAVISGRANRLKNNANPQELYKIARWMLLMGVK